jgi:hypothetical protein
MQQSLAATTLFLRGGASERREQGFAGAVDDAHETGDALRKRPTLAMPLRLLRLRVSVVDYLAWLAIFTCAILGCQAVLLHALSIRE